MPKLELTKKEMAALEYVVENHLRFPVALPTPTDLSHEPHVNRVAIKLGLVDPRERGGTPLE